MAVTDAAWSVAEAPSARPERQRRPVAAREPRLLTPAEESRVPQQLGGAAALLAAAALTDSGIEHYRGAYHDKAMYLSLGIAGLALAAALHGSVDRRREAQPWRGAVGALALAGGIAGTGFHLHNVTKRPGGLSWLNLFYAAPLGAPAALSLAGILGVAAEALRHRRGSDDVAAGRALAGAVALGLTGTVAEAALLHFRGAYHNPAMVIPVVGPPIAAALLARAAIAPQRPQATTRWSLRLLAAIGLLGSAFHAYGVHRNMGGWRNWTQNLLNGPPLPAPPAFTALAIAGLAALRLLRGKSR